jgi:multidrug efflux system membrane fusion protein
MEFLMSLFTKRLTTLVIIMISLSLAIGAVILRKQRTSQVESLAKIVPAPWALHSVMIKKSNLSRSFLALATLNGGTTISISSQISGAIEMMGPREGLQVKKGDLLAKISVSELEEEKEGLKAQLQAAQAELSRIRDEFHRQQQLIKKHVTSQELYESKKTAVLAAQKQVNTIQRQISAQNVRIGYGHVRSPVDALVAARLSEPGDIAMLGKKLYELTINSASRLQVKLPQQVLEQVHPETPVVLNYGRQQKIIHLSRIFPALDNYALGTAEADLNEMPFGLPSGARIPAQVILESLQNVLIVPHQAVLMTAKKGFVFKVIKQAEQTILQRVQVDVLLNTHNALAIRSDELHESDQLIIAHESVLLTLQEGDPVLISPQKNTRG